MDGGSTTGQIDRRSLQVAPLGARKADVQYPTTLSLHQQYILIDVKDDSRADKLLVLKRNDRGHGPVSLANI